MNLGQDYEARFGQDFKFKFSRDADVWLRFSSECLIEILKLKFDQDLCATCDMNSTLGSAVPLAMSFKCAFAVTLYCSCLFCKDHFRSLPETLQDGERLKVEIVTILSTQCEEQKLSGLSSMVWCQ